MPNEPLVPNDLSEKQLNLGYWFVTHKLQLRRVLEIILIVFSLATLGYSGYGLTLDILNAPVREQMLRDLASSNLNPAVVLSQRPKELGAGNVQILVPQGRYDFIATVTNPNQGYAAHFSYRFVAGDFATEPEKEFILPGEQKFVVKLGVTAATRPSGAAIEITGVSWQRIDRHLYPDWKSFAVEHLNLPVTDISYTPEIILEGGKSSIGRTSFTVTNDTGYGYYGVRALVMMYRGPAVVGVNSTVFATLAPNQAAAGEVTWYENYGAVTQIKVIPEVDILDNATYIREK